MKETIPEVQRGLGATRERIDALVDRVGKLRERLDAEISLLQSMERLAAQARASVPPRRMDVPERQDDGSFLASDGWEIALIGEDGR